MNFVVRIGVFGVAFLHLDIPILPLICFIFYKVQGFLFEARYFRGQFSTLSLTLLVTIEFRISTSTLLSFIMRSFALALSRER